MAYSNLALPNGGHATVWSDGLARVTAKDGRVAMVHLPMLGNDGAAAASGQGPTELPMKGDIIASLARGDSQPYAAQDVVVVYRSGVSAQSDLAVPKAQLSGTTHGVPAYTDVPSLNATLAGLGVDHAQQLFRGFGTQRLQQLHASAQAQLGQPVLDFSHAYLLHLSKASVASAVSSLRANPEVSYASPNWVVTTTHTAAMPVPAATLRAARAVATTHAARPALGTAATDSGVPDNFTLTYSSQAMLNRPGVDAVPAFSMIQQKFHQLPGEGEIITNVSLGTLDDASAAANPSDACNFWASAYGPTTIVQNGQRYLDWPSMPLIPTYTASPDGVLDPTGETCGDDPQLVEVGLDFSMMAPLPHNLQRPDNTGSGLTDLLGIAPGARYRLVLPSNPGGLISDVDAAFLAAATQNPRPNVITASLAFGEDAYGFSSRYLEDDPLSAAVISSIVHSYHVVVCISGGDGLRTFTNTAISATGGAAPTQVIKSGGSPSNLNDVAFSGAPSRDFDSGAIDVGATTLDDIFSAPPQYVSNAKLRDQHAFAELRYNGARTFTTGFGSRVDIAAPGDNVVSIAHAFGAPANGVEVLNEGGTSASAPEVAAAAAVALQVARLTHNSSVSANPLAVRRLLSQTGSPVARVPQADMTVNVGHQVDVGQAVRQLLAGRTGGTASVPRVAVEQRQQASALGGTIYTTTDPTQISLSGRLSQAWITIAPDWVSLPTTGVSYRLTAVGGNGAVLGTNPWARLMPKDILGAAGRPLVSSNPQTVQLLYTAEQHGRILASTTVTLTFGPTDGTVPSVLAPSVAPVVKGDTIRIRYDITGLTGATDPTLVVSQPGRIDPATGLYFRPAFTAGLRSNRGVVEVPVSALQGAGIYGIGIQSSPGGWFSSNYSAYAFTRVAPPSSQRPPAPLLSAAGSSGGHYLDIPYHSDFQVTYDVRGVPGATGAMFEVGSGGPNTFNSWNLFNNPNGSIRDNNGHDSGSIAFVPMNGTHGTVTLNSGTLGLWPSMNHVVRVLPVRFGAAAGEASDVSSLTMDGVLPADGGNLANGFGVNAHGVDGFVTSTNGSVETFDQTSNAITKTVESSAHDSYSTLGGGCPGLFQGDVGLYDDYNSQAGTDQQKVLNPVATGTIAGTWTPPTKFANGYLLCPAANQDTPQTAIMSVTPGQSQNDFWAFTSNIAQNTFGPPVKVNSAISSLSSPTLSAFGENSASNTAVIGFADFANYGGPPTIVQADLTHHTVSSFTGVTDGPAEGIAINPTTNQAVTGSFNDFAVYDLGTGAGTRISPGGSTYEHPAVDAVHNEFLLQEVAPPDFFGETPNNNAHSTVIVTDASGNVLKRMEQFNFYNIYLLDMGDYLQVNPATSTAYTLGVNGWELAPVNY